MHPIQYSSTKMMKAERHYSACKIEALAAVFVLRTVRMYLLSAIPLTLGKDRQSLNYQFSKRDLHGRLARWLDLIAEYYLKLKRCNRVLNRGQDFLSRIFQEKKGADGEEEGDIVSVFVDSCFVPCMFTILRHGPKSEGRHSSPMEAICVVGRTCSSKFITQAFFPLTGACNSYAKIS